MEERSGIARVWVKGVETVFPRGADGSKHALIILSLLEEIKLKGWLFGACRSLYTWQRVRQV